MFPPERWTTAAEKWAEERVPQLYFPFLFVVIAGAILGVLIYGGK